MTDAPWSTIGELIAASCVRYADLEALVDRMLDRWPARRPDMADISTTLAATASTATFAPAPTRRADHRESRPRRVPVALIVLGVIVVGALALAAALVGRTDAGRGLIDKLGIGDRSPNASSVAIPLDTATLTSFDPDSDDGVEYAFWNLATAFEQNRWIRHQVSNI